MDPTTDRQWLSGAAAARYLGVTPQTLARWDEGRIAGPAYYWLGGRRAYRVEDLDSWLSRRRVEPTGSG